MISYDSLLVHGQIADGVLQIKDSFSVGCMRRGAAPCMLIYALTAYIGPKAPKIEIQLTAAGQDTPFYQSHSYSVGRNSEYTRQEWRVPPAYCAEVNVTVHIEIPEGTVLCVRDFGTAPDRGARDWHGGMRHNAHLGFFGLAPDNTMPAFELAAACGFPACIVVPKVTADGILVCIHDDTINKTARDKAGNPPLEPIYVWDKTYEALCEWEYGSYKNEIYKGAKLPLLSDFFDLCVKTGMRPMFSTHPGLTDEQWLQVKAMLKCRGLLKNFHIKSFFIDILKKAYAIFGNEIEGYTYDVGKWDETKIETLRTSGIKPEGCRVGIEIQSKDCTAEITKQITDAGYFASIWNVPRCDFADYIRWNTWGITEVTEDHHCSMGLNY